jgi:hypothetical protein
MQTRLTFRWNDAKHTWEKLYTTERPEDICLRFMTPSQIVAHKKLKARAARPERECADAWEIALSSAKVSVYDDNEENVELLRDREKRSELEIALAEQMMLDTGFIPPHWMHMSECDNCGFMPARLPGDRCAWCHAGTGVLMAEALGSEVAL